jgi:hypothetical protein
MTADRDRDGRGREVRAKSADEELDRAIEEAAAAEEPDGVAEDASFESFLERFPPAARGRRPPE